jgi:integrase
LKKRSAKRTKGQGSVFPREGSPLWQLSYWNGWRQVRESSATTDHAEAIIILQRKLGEIAATRPAGVEQIRTGALLQMVINDCRRDDQADLRETEQPVNRLLKPYFGQMSAEEFSTKALNNYINQRQELDRTNGTINREWAHLRRAFLLGYQNEPQLVFRLTVVKSLREDNVCEGFLKADKYYLILDELTEEIKPVFVVAYHLGMRTGELLAIKRSWVDLPEELIHVNGRVTKNRASKTAPIYRQMKPWLEKLLSQGEQESPKCVWLFSTDGKPIKRFRADLVKACEAAGVPGLLFHNLRRKVVRNMIRAGVPEKVAMQISGHKTASMLWRYNITDTTDTPDVKSPVNVPARIRTQKMRKKGSNMHNNLRSTLALKRAKWCPGRDLNPYSGAN